MEGAIDFQDWELLQGAETAVAVAVRPAEEESKGPSAAEEVDSDDGIKKDYFSLDYDQRYGRRRIHDEEEEEESLADSDNPSWVDPETEPRFSEEAKGKLAVGGLELPHRGFDGLWTSEESSDDQKSPAQRSEKGLCISDILRVGVGEVEQLRESFEMDYSAKSVNAYNNESKIEGFGESGFTESYRVEESEGSDDISSAGSVTNNDADSPQESDTESKSSENQSTGIRQSSGVVWWKLPVELLKFCVFKLRPVWSISIAAAFMGFVMLGRKLYKMNRRAKNIPFRVNIDDKKASQFALRAARLNEAFSVVRRVPIIKAPLPSNGIAPWPVLALR